jgi:hypothetical protein
VPEPKQAARVPCAPVDPAKVAPFTCDAKVVKTPVPGIEDDAALAPFYDKLVALARSGKQRVRVGVYGDSNLTSDFFTGHLRRVLQQRYGDAGHGYVSMSHPWGSYKHEDVVHGGYWAMFHMYAPTTHIAPDRQYGFANMAAESRDVGAAAWVGTTKDRKSPVGKAVKSFELYFLKQPKGGSFHVQLDGKNVREVSTDAPGWEAGFEVIDTTDDAHELQAVVKGDGPVRLCGASLDREGPGIQIDSLGAGSLNFERLRWVANGTRRQMLTRRAYDLVVIWLGANIMWVPPNEDLALEFLGEVQASLPGVPILILGPSDTVRGDEQTTDPRIPKLITQMRGVAKAKGAAFWDFREAMGGDGSIIKFTKRGLTGADHVHFGPEGSALMADRLLCALSERVSAHVEKKPEAGCPASP